MVETVRVDGLKELEAKLRALGEEYGAKAALSPVRSALRKAGKVVQQSAQNRVRRKTGTLAENIIVAADRKPPDGQLSVKVTVRAKAKAYKSNSTNVRKGRIGLEYQHYGPLFYARFLEFGTSKMSAYPFLRPAFEENKGNLPQIIKAELAAAIERSVKRLGK